MINKLYLPIKNLNLVATANVLVKTQVAISMDVTSNGTIYIDRFKILITATTTGLKWEMLVKLILSPTQKVIYSKPQIHINKILILSSVVNLYNTGFYQQFM